MAFADSLQKIGKLKDLPAHLRSDPDSDAWDALQKAMVQAKKDEAQLDGHAEDVMRETLEFLVKRYSEKRALQKRIAGVLKQLVVRPQWLAVARKMADKLRPMLEDSPDLAASLDPEPETAKDSKKAGYPAAGDEPPVAAAASDAEENPIRANLREGRRIMSEFNWQFPVNPLGTEMDAATKGFSLFFDAITKCTTTCGQRSLDCDVGDVLKEFQDDFRGILDFCLSMYELRTRSAFKSRVKFVIIKMQQMSPEFAEACKQRGRLPWVEGVVEEEPEQTEEAPKPGVVWIDYKRAAYETSELAKMSTLALKGFCDDSQDDAYAPPVVWLAYILERVGTLGEVCVVILNKNHQQTMRDIVAFCSVSGNRQPLFVVCTREPDKTKKLLAELDITNAQVTKDWKIAAEYATAEVEIRLAADGGAAEGAADEDTAAA